MQQFYHPPTKTANLPDYGQLPKLTAVIKRGLFGRQFVFDAYYSASHVTEWFVDGKTLRELVDSALWFDCQENDLPLGPPNYYHYRVPVNYAAIPGDVVGIRCTWPNETELPT